jgi:hypothetical protein
MKKQKLVNRVRKTRMGNQNVFPGGPVGVVDPGEQAPQTVVSRALYVRCSTLSLVSLDGKPNMELFEAALCTSRRK